MFEWNIKTKSTIIKREGKFIYKIPMTMKFIDEIGQCFLYNKTTGKFDYICSIQI